jgi:NAD(P)-dependent dehydrogenase (short-subunit alcohol dehydrogenase family)
VACIAVTGSASGIGAALRVRLEDAGARVIGIDVRGAEVIADLSKDSGRRVAIAETLERSGDALDGFVACAGVGPAVAAPSLIVSVNYYGAVELLDAFNAALSASGAGAAVLVASNSATTVPEIPDELVEAILAGDEGSARWAVEDVDPTVAYAASKLALARAMRRRAPQWAQQGVRLNAVAPGAVATPLLDETLADEQLGPMVRAFPIPVARFGTPAEIAAAIDFLLGPLATFCVGTVLFADGGTDALVRPDRF